jgi:hypothetical protein
MLLLQLKFTTLCPPTASEKQVHYVLPCSQAIGAVIKLHTCYFCIFKRHRNGVSPILRAIRQHSHRFNVTVEPKCRSEND